MFDGPTGPAALLARPLSRPSSRRRSAVRSSPPNAPCIAAVPPGGPSNRGTRVRASPRLPPTGSSPRAARANSFSTRSSSSPIRTTRPPKCARHSARRRAYLHARSHGGSERADQHLGRRRVPRWGPDLPARRRGVLDPAHRAERPASHRRAIDAWPGPSFSTWHEAHNAFGSTETGTKWVGAYGHALARLGAITFYLIANPGDAAAEVTITPLTSAGLSARGVKTITIPPHSRATVPVHAAGRGGCPLRCDRREHGKASWDRSSSSVPCTGRSATCRGRQARRRC